MHSVNNEWRVRVKSRMNDRTKKKHLQCQNRQCDTVFMQNSSKVYRQEQKRCAFRCVCCCCWCFFYEMHLKLDILTSADVQKKVMYVNCYLFCWLLCLTGVRASIMDVLWPQKKTNTAQYTMSR